jgi:hypothetical protein
MRARLLAVALVTSCRARAPAPTPDAAVERPPVRPASVVGRAHLGRPRATVEAINDALDARRPADFLLAVALGVDVAVLSAIDPARPIDVALLSSPAGAYAFAMTPAGAGHARSLLSSRYRFVPEAGLGERLTLRGDPGLSSPEHRLPCALVRVSARVPSRVVCASDEAALREAGRWVAFESAARADDPADLDVTFDGEGLARDVAPALRGATALLQRQLLAAASAARRAHERPPDYGDPEALVGLLGEAVTALARDVAAARSLTLHADVSGATGVDLTLRVAFPTTGGAALADDARARVGVAGPHPLHGLLPADALVTAASRTSLDARRAWLASLVTSSLRVLGDRVLTPEIARRDLDALLANAGEAVAFAAAPDGRSGVELTLALAQTDQGAAARAVLARMALAPWLRGLRLGAPVTVTTVRDGLVVTAAPPGQAVTAAALGVRQGALVVVLGHHAGASLDAVNVRSPVEGTETESAFGELRMSPAEPALRVRYGAAREAAGDVVATARGRVPMRVVAALAALAE